MLIAPKWLKLRTSNLTCVLPGTVRASVPLFFGKGRGQGYVNPEFLVSRADQTHIVHRTATKWAWSARVTKFVISHFLKYFALFNDRPFKFYTQFKREECKRFIHTMVHKWAWSGNVTKFVILHPLNYFGNS